jgi:biopolymer transport protein ExbD
MLRGRRENKLLVEPAAVATGDIAFNLIVFFLVCASTQPGSGRKQELPRSEQTKSEQKMNNIEIALTRAAKIVSVNGEPVKIEDLPARLTRLLSGKTRPEDKVVILKTKPDVPYEHWIAVAALIQDKGASLTIQREEEQTVVVGS